MAITNAQQYKQILQKVREEKAFGGLMGIDGRKAYVGGSYSEVKSGPQTGKEKGTYQGGSGVAGSAESKGMGGSGNQYDGGGGYGDAKVDYGTAQQDYLTGVTPTLDDLKKAGVPKSNIPYLGTYLNMAAPFRNKILEKNIDYFTGLSQTKYPQTVQGYKDYMADRLAGKITATGNTVYNNDDGPMDILPLPSGGDGDGNDGDTQDPFKMNLRLLADGGMPEDAPVYKGGIMDLESGRQMYFLGKLVKKVTRGVKKIAKSPVGKMALLGLGAGMAGFGPAKGLFASGKGLGFKKFITDSIMGKAIGVDSPAAGNAIVRSGGLLDFIKSNPYKTIGGITALTGLMTPKEEEEKNNDDYYASNTIDYDYVRRHPFSFSPASQMGSRFNVADGGIMRNGYAEGSEEPVAKKTMPLLDMDGQEMDLREEGGFVPLGRMERADDVPARLSKNEFVFTADAVRNAGEGDVDKGAEVMYNMMKNLESGGEVSEESQGLEGAREMFQTSQRLEEVI